MDTWYVIVFPDNLGPVVQNFVSLTSSLRLQLKKMLTTLANTQLFLLIKCENPLQRILTFCQQKITVFCNIHV